MKQHVWKSLAWVLLITLSTSFGVAAQSGGVYEITRATIESGGTTSQGGSFEVTGTIGQYEANGKTDVAVYQLTGGFWVGGSGNGNDLIFKDGFE